LTDRTSPNIATPGGPGAGDQRPAISARLSTTILVYLTLVVFTCLFFREPLFGERTFYVWDLSLGYAPVQVDNAGLRSAGEIPLWNRHIALGYPITAETESSGVYPPGLIFNLVQSPARAFAGFILFHYFLTLAGTMYLARVAKIGLLGQASAALIFVYGGSFIAQTVNLPVVTTLAWTPWILGLHLRALVRESWRFGILAGVALAVQISGGHLQIAFYTLLLILLCTAVAGRERLRFSIPETGLVFGAGLGLAAPQILYTLDLIRHTERATRLAYDTLVSFSLPPHYLIQLLVPDLLGGEGSWVGVDNIYELRVYFGLTALGLIALGWRTPGPMATVFRITLIAGLVLALGRYIGIYHFLGLLPGFGSIRAPARWLLIASLGAAILAGFGIERLLHGWGPLRSATRRLALAYLVLAVALAAGTLWASRIAEPGAVADGILRFAMPGAQRVALPTGLVGSELVADALRAATVAVGGGVLTAAVFLLFSRATTRRTAGIAGISAVALLAADLLATQGGFHRFTPDSSFAPTSPIVAFLRAQPGLWRVRSYVVEDSLDPIPADLVGNSAGLFDIDSTSVLWSSSYEDLERYFAPGVNMKEVGLFNVRYVLSARPMNDRSLRLRLEEGERLLYENALWQPRVSVREEWQVIPDVMEAKRAIRGDGFRLERSVILNEPPRFLDGDPFDVPPTAAAVEVVDYGAQQVLLKATLPRPAVLVISDLQHPGWRATSNGRPVEILVANALVRGLALGPGVHDLELRYSPRSFRAGLYVAGFTLLAVWGVFLGARSSRRRGPPKSS